MDALVAYLQMLGTLVDFSTYDAARRATAEETTMETYYASCAHFADSWGLLSMMAIFFVGVVVLIVPARRAASSPTMRPSIPFKDETEDE